MIDPIVFSIGSFSIRWYSLGYIFGFGTAYLLMRYRLKHEDFNYPLDLIHDAMLWGIIGVVLGGRLGFVFFYAPAYFLANPLEIIVPFNLSTGQFTGISGMSFHGGLIAVILVGWWLLKKYKVNFWDFADFVIPALPLGYTFGRLGNFANSELYGRATDSVFGMYFATDPEGLLRHPSQLYEAGLEGLVLFVILWSIRKKAWAKGKMLGFYLIGYGLARFIVEFVRELDPHTGLVIGPFTMGQVLSSLMIFAGLGLIWWRRKKD